MSRRQRSRTLKKLQDAQRQLEHRAKMGRLKDIRVQLGVLMKDNEENIAQNPDVKVAFAAAIQNSKTEALVEILCESGLLDRAQFDLNYMTRTLNKLETFRKSKTTVDDTSQEASVL